MSDLEDAERALEQAGAALARSDVDGLVAHLSGAIRAFTAAGEKCRAAMACVRLGDVLSNAMGNQTAGRAWFARARRLVEDQPPCIEQGWVAVAAMGCDVDDPAELLSAAELALERARRFGDVNLETKALADAGLARVQAGRVPEGMALLDEAMALACGVANDTETAAKSVCSFFTACYYAADFERAGSWAALLRQHGLISGAPGPQVFLSSHCDSVQASLLVELGRWAEAEAVLVRAKAAFESAMHMPSWHPDIALADLRTRQGRLAEAEALLLGKDQALQALLPAARLHLARGDFELACAVARRGLRVVRDDRLRAVELLTVLVDAELARGHVEAATQACRELTARTRGLDVPTLQARADAARARTRAAAGAVSEAIDILEATLDRVDAQQLPYLRATLLSELARLRSPEGDGPVVRRAALAREGKWWIASCDGSRVRLPDTKGLRYLAELVARPGSERHVLGLVDGVEGVAPKGGPDRRSLGDAGEMIDARARAEYRRRIEDLRAEVDDSLAAGLLETAEAKQAEIDALVAQLAQAFGLGGRDRRAASAAERARLNVTRALRAAIGRLDEALPGKGEVLQRRIRTGLYCVYEPAPEDEVRWVVQS